MHYIFDYKYLRIFWRIFESAVVQCFVQLLYKRLKTYS